MREKKFPKSTLAFAILCAIYILAYVIFFVTYAQAHRSDRIVMAVIVAGGLCFSLLIFDFVRKNK